jgi:transposase InsO family protein
MSVNISPRRMATATRIVGEYIDGYYNTKRRHSFIDYESPIQFELKSMLAAMAA